MFKYRVTSNVSKNTKSHTDKEKMKDDTKTMTGCISTDPSQMNITKNRQNSKNTIYKDRHKNTVTRH